VEGIGHGSAVSVEIGDPAKQREDFDDTLPLWAIAELRGSTTSLTAGDQLEQLSLHARVLRAYAGDILQGDLTSFPRVRTLVEHRLASLREEEEKKDLDRISIQASTAFHAKDYAMVVQLLNPHVSSLTEHSKKLLTFSLKQTDQSDGTDSSGASPLPD
jgi:hypothetical protein